jgi:hypothetical protein
VIDKPAGWSTLGGAGGGKKKEAASQTTSSPSTTKSKSNKQQVKSKGGRGDEYLVFTLMKTTSWHC